MSITKVQIDTESKQVKIYTQLFIDDFEQLLNDRYNLNKVNFEAPKETTKTTIEDYVTKKLQLKCNRSPIELAYLGFEVEGELVYLYLEGKLKTKKIGRIDVENTMLQEIFTEQQNKIDITYNNVVKSIYLNTGVPFGTIYF